MKTEDVTITDAICTIIGYESLEALCRELSGLRWRIPMHAPKELRDARIREEFSGLMTAKSCPTTSGAYQALGTKYGLHPDYVRKLIGSGPMTNLSCLESSS